MVQGWFGELSRIFVLRTVSIREVDECSVFDIELQLGFLSFSGERDGLLSSVIVFLRRDLFVLPCSDTGLIMFIYLFAKFSRILICLFFTNSIVVLNAVLKQQ